jgi:hypothetical protein
MRPAIALRIKQLTGQPREVFFDQLRPNKTLWCNAVPESFPFLARREATRFEIWKN